MTPARPRCSVVIPSYNGRHLLEACLASVARHRPRDGTVEILVADDGSTDGTVGWLMDAHPDVRIVRLDQNRGFCAAANAGIAASRGEFLQLLNNDTEVCAGWIDAGLAPFDDPAVGSVAPLVLIRADPSRVDSAGDQFAVFGWPSKRGHGETAEKWIGHPADRVFGAGGSSALYRATALAITGAFDPAFGSYYEDVDLAFRLRWAGFECAFAPGCRILHEVSASYDHARPDLQRRMARNAEVLFWANLPLPWLIAAAVPHAGFVAAQAAWRIVRGRGGPFARGKLDALRDVAGIRERRRVRRALRASSLNRPRLGMTGPSLRDVRNHLRRPGEASARARA